MGAIGGHAVVIGGSMGGLSAAAVLAGRFEKVTVIDRDAFPDHATDRRGVPQMGHAHALLISGKQVLEGIFPGLTDQLTSGGAVPFDPGWDLLFHQMGAMRTRFRSGKLGISLSRAYLEHTVRERVRALDNVAIHDRLSVIGLHGTRRRVSGVVVDGDRTVHADLVVDATGRSGNRSEAWLRTLDCPAPDVTHVKIDVGYTTWNLRRKPGDTIGDGGLLYLMSAVPPLDKRAAAVFAVEDDRWMVTLGGWHRSHAPTDPEGFHQFAEALPDPLVSKLLATAEPLDARPHKFTYPQARRRHFEKLRVLPTGYVALGDAICSFNPLYGQGMTAGAMAAVALGSCLDRAGRPDADMARAYYRQAARLLATPWQMSTSSDFMYPETVGPRPPGTSLANRYVRRLMLAAHVSQEAHTVLLDLQHLLTQPTSIFRPATIVRALTAARRSPGRPPRGAEA